MAEGQEMALYPFQQCNGRFREGAGRMDVSSGLSPAEDSLKEDMTIGCIKDQQQHEMKAEAAKGFWQKEAAGRVQYSSKQKKKNWRQCVCITVP